MAQDQQVTHTFTRLLTSAEADLACGKVEKALALVPRLSEMAVTEPVFALLQEDTVLRNRFDHLWAFTDPETARHDSRLVWREGEATYAPPSCPRCDHCAAAELAQVLVEAVEAMLAIDRHDPLVGTLLLDLDDLEAEWGLSLFPGPFLERLDTVRFAAKDLPSRDEPEGLPDGAWLPSDGTSGPDPEDLRGDWDGLR